LLGAIAGGLALTLSACASAGHASSRTSRSATSTSAPVVRLQAPGLTLTNADSGGTFHVKVGEAVHVLLTPDPVGWASITGSPVGVLDIQSETTSGGPASALFLVVSPGVEAIMGQRKPVCPPGFTGGCTALAPFTATLNAST
jgi:hypothetical protein